MVNPHIAKNMLASQLPVKGLICQILHSNSSQLNSPPPPKNLLETGATWFLLQKLQAVETTVSLAQNLKPVLLEQKQYKYGHI